MSEYNIYFKINKRNFEKIEYGELLKDIKDASVEFSEAIENEVCYNYINNIKIFERTKLDDIKNNIYNFRIHLTGHLVIISDYIDMELKPGDVVLLKVIACVLIFFLLKGAEARAARAPSAVPFCVPSAGKPSLASAEAASAEPSLSSKIFATNRQIAIGQPPMINITTISQVGM